MIRLCPFCGNKLPRVLVDGITSCENCSRIFDSNKQTRLLSAGWLARIYHIDCKEQLIGYGFSDEEADFVDQFVIQKTYSPQEFEKLVKENFDLIACA